MTLFSCANSTLMNCYQRLQTGLSFVPPTTTDMADWIAIRDTNGENSNGAKRTKEGTMAKGSAIPPERMPRPCRLVLAVRVGRGNVKIPVLIELSNVIIENFELVVTIDLNSEFPHLQSVNIALPEAARKRTIDFALRPLMALDLISIPGLHQAIESAIDNALKGTLGALDENGVRGKTINIAKKPERDQIKEPELALGVLRCRMIGAMNLRPRSTYKAVLKIGDRELMSTVAINDRGSPQWNQVMDVPLSALTFANSEGWPGTDTLVIEVQDTDVLAINNKPLRTKPLRLREWLNAAKGFGPGVTSEEAMAQLPGGSEERKIVQAWGLPLAAEVRSKKLYDPSNSLGLRDKPVSDAMIPQIQIVLRYFSLEDLAAEAKITWPVPKERQGLVTIRIHNAVNLKDTTSLIPSFDQDPNAAASVSTSASGAAVAVTNTVMGVAKGVLNVATSGVNTFTSLVTGTFEPYVAVYDAEWDSSKSAWKEGRLRFQTPPVLAATGDPVWECTRQILSENVDDVFLMIKVSSKMDLGGTSLPVGKCVISLKEALAIKDEFFGLWWPLDGEGSGRIRIGFEFAPLQLPIKELTSRSDVHEMLSADVHMMPDYDFRRGATLGMSDGTEYVSLFDGIDQGVSKFAQKPMTATVGIAKDLAATPLAMGGRVAEEMKGTFGSCDTLFERS